MYNFFDPEDIGDSVYQFCKASPVLCKALVETFTAIRPDVDNYDRAETFLTHFPSGAGWRNVFHYGQIIHAQDFIRYDYGAKKNLEKYGSEKPPLYPLTDIKEDLPMAFFSGDLDDLGTPTDV